MLRKTRDNRMKSSSNLDDILHVEATEIHGAAVDVVQDQLHVVALDHGQEESDHVISLLLLVICQQLLDEGRHRGEDNPVSPEAGVLREAFSDNKEQTGFYVNDSPYKQF